MMFAPSSRCPAYKPVSRLDLMIICWMSWLVKCWMKWWQGTAGMQEKLSEPYIQALHCETLNWKDRTAKSELVVSTWESCLFVGPFFFFIIWVCLKMVVLPKSTGLSSSSLWDEPWKYQWLPDALGVQSLDLKMGTPRFFCCSRFGFEELVVWAFQFSLSGFQLGSMWRLPLQNHLGNLCRLPLEDLEVG